MSKKHFIALATSLHNTKPLPEEYSDGAEYTFAIDQWQRDIRAIAITCAESNPKFRHVSFLDACYNGCT